MSENSEKLQSAYRSFAASGAGKHLLAKLENAADTLRRNAYKKDAQAAWADLQKAEAYQEILDHVSLMIDIDDIGKLNNKRRSPLQSDV